MSPKRHSSGPSTVSLEQTGSFGASISMSALDPPSLRMSACQSDASLSPERTWADEQAAGWYSPPSTAVRSSPGANS